jgi:hypothetical protein
MIRSDARRRPAFLAMALMLLLLGPAGCGDDDDNPAGPAADGTEVAGIWLASAFSVDGTDGIAAGMGVAMTFTITSSTALRHAEGTYDIQVTNDQLGLCEGAVGDDCNPHGELEVEDGMLIFDPTEEDPTTFDYSVTGNTMTLSGDIDGIVLSATLTKSTGT